ncbi:site-specific integrase [Roseibacterium sp. SDUM158017]|uniref:tyrosine-type recombinase/integrase n=1 Tax=Roseicyclus salinarum TaxID=3036773 RepID=UPI00241523D4|nr:site-specific integrase [Roseibacterium sp. SDUM158017]MDG4647105.1 site-specific integrase [Roseibacterium sp. SDUM158017]
MLEPQIDPVERGFSFCEPAETLNAFFDEHYFPHCLATTRGHRHTRLTYEKHLRDTLGPMRWEEITPLALNAWLRRQVQEALKNTTINKHIFLVNRLLRTARDWGAIPEGVRPPPYLRKLATGDYRQRFLSQEEIARLLAECDRINHPYLSLFIRFLLLTGARKGEARKAKWRDMEIAVGLWRVPVSKNGRSRRIMLSAAAIQVLRRTEARSRELGLRVSADDYVFLNPRTGTCYNSFHIAYFKARDAAGLPDVRIHDLRHTFASLLINNGVSLYEVQELLGHSSTAMTQRYAHLQPNQLRSRTEIVSRLVDGGAADGGAAGAGGERW